MAILDSTLDLQSFYPSDLEILSVEEADDKIIRSEERRVGKECRSRGSAGH